MKDCRVESCSECGEDVRLPTPDAERRFEKKRVCLACENRKQKIPAGGATCGYPGCSVRPSKGRAFCSQHKFCALANAQANAPEPEEATEATADSSALRTAVGEALAATNWRGLPLAVQLRVAAEVSRG